MKMILEVDEAKRRQLVESLVREAVMRERDPVLGIYREYARVWNELLRFKDLVHSNSGRIRQLQSQIMRMKKGYHNGNGSNIMPVSSGHIQWRYQNHHEANLGGAGACMIEGIPFSGNNMQNRLYVKNDNQEQAVVSSSVVPLPPELPPEFHGW